MSDEPRMYSSLGYISQRLGAAREMLLCENQELPLHEQMRLACIEGFCFWAHPDDFPDPATHDEFEAIRAESSRRGTMHETLALMSDGELAALERRIFSLTSLIRAARERDPMAHHARHSRPSGAKLMHRIVPGDA